MEDETKDWLTELVDNSDCEGLKDFVLDPSGPVSEVIVMVPESVDRGVEALVDETSLVFVDTKVELVSMLELEE